MAISVLIPDGECTLIFSIVNGFSQIREIDIYVMSNIENNLIKYSRHIKHFSYYPKTIDEKTWISNIDYEQNKYDISLVMPIYEDGIGTLISHKDSVCFKDKLCMMPSYQNFSTALNKISLSHHMVKNKISCSSSFVLNKYYLKKDKLCYPVLIKPAEGIGGGKGISKFFDRTAIEKFFADNENLGNKYLVEQFIEGFDFSCNVLCKNGEILVYTIQKGILFDEVPFTSPIGVKFLFESKLYKEIENLMKSLEWSGVANIDVRYDSITDDFKIIEINPRFWGSLDASLAAGVNFPYLYLLASLGEKIEKVEYDFIEYLDFNGLVKTLKKDKTIILNMGFILNNTQLKFILKDPILFLIKLYVRLKLLFRTKSKKPDSI
jgi:D-aspartate ligase